MTEAAFASHIEHVRGDWVTAGHLDVAGFARLFDRATDAFRESLGIGTQYAEQMQIGLVVAESHCTYLREATEGDVVRFGTWLLGVAENACTYFMKCDEIAIWTSLLQAS